MTLNSTILEIVDSLAAQDSLNVLSDLMNPAQMTRSVYAGLQTLSEKLAMDVAQGHDCNPGFYEKVAEVERLMDAAPWTLSNDHGIVSKSEHEAMIDGLLPDWAVGHTTDWTEIGAQLLTKDGRRCGNAVLESKLNEHSYRAITDVGTQMILNEAELREVFHQPRFKLDLWQHAGVNEFKLRSEVREAPSAMPAAFNPSLWQILNAQLQRTMCRLLGKQEAQHVPMPSKVDPAEWVNACNERGVNLESQRDLMWKLINDCSLGEVFLSQLKMEHPVAG